MSLESSFSIIGKERIAPGYGGELSGGHTYLKAESQMLWLASQVRGASVLDIGCREGNLGILLGKEGTIVCGVDTNNGAIEYALDRLGRESQEVRRRVSFLCSEIVSLELDQLYNTVVMGEVIALVTNPKRLVEKGSSFCKEDGALLITTPLGFTGDADHKVVFTLSSFLGLFDGNTMITPVSLDVVDGVIRFVGIKTPSTHETWVAFRDSLHQLFIAEKELSDLLEQSRLFEYTNSYKTQVGKTKKMKSTTTKKRSKMLDRIPEFETDIFQQFNDSLRKMHLLELKNSSFMDVYKKELDKLVNSCVKLDQIFTSFGNPNPASGSNAVTSSAIVSIIASKITDPLTSNISKVNSKIKRLEKDNLSLYKKLDECGMKSKFDPSRVKGKFRVGILGISTAERERLVASATKAFQKNGMQGACEVLEQSKLPYMNQAYILDEVLVAVS